MFMRIHRRHSLEGVDCLLNWLPYSTFTLGSLSELTNPSPISNVNTRLWSLIHWRRILQLYMWERLTKNWRNWNKTENLSIDALDQSKHLKGCSVPRVSNGNLFTTRDFKVFLFLDALRIRMSKHFAVLPVSGHFPYSKVSRKSKTSKLLEVFKEFCQFSCF